MGLLNIWDLLQVSGSPDMPHDLISITPFVAPTARLLFGC
jgi:hypothetical protein